MTRSLVVGLLLGGVFLAHSSSSLDAQQPPPTQNLPGMPTLARVHVLNRDRAEAVPVKIQNIGDSLPVIVVGEPLVQMAPTTVLGVRTARQVWEYRRQLVPVADDPTPALNAAGLDGWEAVGSLVVGSNTVWTLKRPR
jgi:hypothetical protein